MEPTNHNDTLKKLWDTLYQSKESKLILRGNIDNVHFKKTGSFYTIINESYKSKRPSTVPSNQKIVFMNFDSQKFNFTQVSNKEILLHVNLDQEQVITPENAHKLTQKYFEQDEGQGQIQGHAHPVLINTAPICRYHCVLSMYPEQQLPQVVGSDIMLLLLNIFKLFDGIKIGYNSLGASATVNHLHFHMLFSEQLTGEKFLPIQKAERKLWLKSSLINPQQQINMYSVGVQIEEIIQDDLYCFVISPIKSQQADRSQACNSLSFVFEQLVNQLIQMSIPHNMLISDNGMSIYVFVRDFSTNNCGWIQYSGVEVVTQSGQYESANQEGFRKRRKMAQIDVKMIEIVKKNVKNHLSKFI